MKHPRAALSLLGVGLFLSYCWQWVPAQHAGAAAIIAASALVIYLLTCFGLFFASYEVWLTVALIAAFKAIVIGCNVWFIADPWPVKPGQALCSARLNWPLGLVGLALGAALFLHLRKKGKP